MGIRTYGWPLLAMHAQFLFGSGERWFFDSQVLESGDGATRSSDTEKLLLNTLHWLVRPSLGNNTAGAIGGWIQNPDRLVYPHKKLTSTSDINETHYKYDKDALSRDPVADDGSRVFSGLIGAQNPTSLVPVALWNMRQLSLLIAWTFSYSWTLSQR